MNTHKNLITLALLTLLTAAVALPALAGDGVVNINKASESELTLLPRIGPSLASRILAFREENGGFKSIEDLLLVSGIGEKTYELLRHWVVTSGETTLSSKVNLSRARERAAEPQGKSDDKAKDDDAKDDQE
jgi:competence ComEA-like helix-hairpin-helix protein